MSKLKLATIVGTRPELIKLSETIKLCDKLFDHVLIHTGQNYDYALNQVFFEGLNLRAPDHYLDVAGAHLGEMIGNVISRSYALLSEIKPDAALILGDTNSAMSAISAKRLKIPVFHMEAGNRCFDENLPEEINRRIIDHISDVNLPYTEHARRYLQSENIRPEYTFVVGSPMREVLTNNAKPSDVLTRLELNADGYIVLSAHREENIDIEDNFFSLMNSINDMAERFGLPVIYSVHPRSAKFIERREFVFHPLVRRVKPFGFSDYIALQECAFCVVSDSGTLAEESGILGFAAVSIRTSTERPEAVEKGCFVLGGIEGAGLIQAVTSAVSLRGRGASVPDYGDSDVSAKVAGIIQGYTGIVNKMIWRKKV
ncbi:UDP-N-acetylglucosamine 2-epimerase (non-hydrolyzing) [Synergistales bacterium]|nr:UDP-N-acetylglucosamine 2-epimerase (non-hydrolyzing) [Synergistales bacterium]